MRRGWLLSALSCGGKSQTDPMLSSGLWPLGRLCVLVIATFSPGSSSLQSSSTFWKPFVVVVCKSFVFSKLFLSNFPWLFASLFTSFYMIFSLLCKPCVIFLRVILLHFSETFLLSFFSYSTRNCWRVATLLLFSIKALFFPDETFPNWTANEKLQIFISFFPLLANRETTIFCARLISAIDSVSFQFFAFHFAQN